MTLQTRQLQSVLIGRKNYHDETVRLRSKLFLTRIVAVIGWVFVVVLTVLWPR